MSVETAREDFQDAAHAWAVAMGDTRIPLDEHTPAIGDRLVSTFNDMDATLDHLILEVRAAMPCYEWDDCEAQRTGGVLMHALRICPSCQAKQELDDPR